MYFKLRGVLPYDKKVKAEIIGGCSIVVLWYIMYSLHWLPEKALPNPLKVITAFPRLHMELGLVRNALYSLSLNVLGMLEAVVLAVPIGFILGLYPLPRAIVERYLSASRFIPIPVLMGLFIALFGIAMNMKVQFLALAIFVYLVPQVILQIDLLEPIYDETVMTLGATPWQRIKHVFIPGVMPRIYNDIVVLSPISWTYIVVAEAINTNDGGIGAMAYLAGRTGQADILWALVITILVIAVTQDKALILIDKLFFKFKYAQVCKVECKKEVKK